MATSGTISFTLNANEIVRKAFKKLGILSHGEELQAEQLNDGLEDLNLMIKAWIAQDIHLWTYQEAELFLEKEKNTYLLGAGGDHASAITSKTTITVDALSGAGSITVDDASGISDQDNIGVVLDDDTIFWTVVNGAPAGNVVTLLVVLPGDASLNNRVYSYTKILQRPLKITQARRTNRQNQDIPMSGLSRRGYFALPNKSNLGIPVQFYFNPTLNNSTVRVWPTPSTSNDTMRMTVIRQLEDVDQITDNMDFPQEWLEAIIYNLADRIADEYGLDDRTLGRISAKASMYLEIVKDYDDEAGSVFFRPETDWSARDVGEFYD